MQDQFEVPQEAVHKMYNDKFERLDKLGITTKVEPLGFEISSFYDNKMLVSTVD